MTTRTARRSTLARAVAAAALIGLAFALGYLLHPAWTVPVPW